MAQQKQIRPGTTRLQVRSLASLRRLRIWRYCKLWYIGRRHGLDLALLWLWRRPAAVSLIRPLAWEPPYGLGEALKKSKKKKSKKKEHIYISNNVCFSVILCKHRQPKGIK